MKNVTLVTLILMMTLSGYAQPDHDSAQIAKSQMQHLAILTGHWEGEGWSASPDGARREFKQIEDIRFKLGDLLLQIEGKGFNKDTGEIIHDALAIVRYDPIESKFDFRSYLSTGQTTSADFAVNENRITWSFKAGGGTIKYTINVVDRSKWTEIGQFSRDGENWFQFFAMELVKTSESTER